MNSFGNEVILIAGGVPAIGRAAAFRFAEAGTRVVITGHRAEPLQSLGQAIENIDYVRADAADPHDASRTIGTVIERWERLDVRHGGR
jgi:NADP-dependent 3-hydroxy acid dehydrogenase YdfG